MTSEQWMAFVADMRALQEKHGIIECHAIIDLGEQVLLYRGHPTELDRSPDPLLDLLTEYLLSNGNMKAAYFHKTIFPNKKKS